MEMLPELAPQAAESRIDTLTPRQRHTLELLAQGYSNTAIGAEMSITSRSVENYINVIFSILGLTNLKGRHPRVLAALGVHYQVSELAPIGLLIRFFNASRRLRVARIAHERAQSEFALVRDTLQDLSGYEIREVEP
ncbi:MAG TPA: helix-turn-helix transcriptional regulator [Dehalococcoidia bacterium]|nr:helix-turn-helix transcriptional regulator [Dehalococcoidia bacterium]